MLKPKLAFKLDVLKVDYFGELRPGHADAVALQCAAIFVVGQNRRDELLAQRRGRMENRPGSKGAAIFG